MTSATFPAASIFLQNMNLGSFLGLGGPESDWHWIRFPSQVVVGLQQKIFNLKSTLQRSRSNMYPKFSVHIPIPSPLSNSNFSTIFGIPLQVTLGSTLEAKQDSTTTSTSPCVALEFESIDHVHRMPISPDLAPPPPPPPPKRSPKTSLKALLYHSLSLCALTSRRKESSAQHLAKEILIHSVGVLDIALAGEFQDTCVHVLNGISTILHSHPQLFQPPVGLTKRPLVSKITHLLKQLDMNTPLHNQDNETLKHRFLQLQLKLFLLILNDGETWTVDILDNVIQIQQTMTYKNSSILRELQWETAQAFRNEYWSILVQIIDTNIAETENEAREFEWDWDTKFGEPKEDQNQRNWKSDYTYSPKTQYKPDEKRKSNSEPRPPQNPWIIRPPPPIGPGPQFLILDLSNHLLQLYNAKLNFACGKQNQGPMSKCAGRVLVGEVLFHQIGALDLVLSIGALDLAELTVLGIWDTVRSCTTITCTRDSNTVSTTTAQLRGIGIGIGLCREAIEQSQCMSTLKLHLMKLQLEALVLVLELRNVDDQLPLEPANAHQIQLQESLSTVYGLLGNEWRRWVKYFGFGWNSIRAGHSVGSLGLDPVAQATQHYWKTMREFYECSCGAH